MRVQHNINALNASRNLGINNTQLGKKSEKLSSGYRVNRAADDAAGLAISEKMRNQIRGLKQASTNAQNGISLIQTAEGALNEVHSILQRMSELAVQSANDVNDSTTDRNALNKELGQLKEEINRIGETTEFNKMSLLSGDFAATDKWVDASGTDVTSTAEAAIAAIESNIETAWQAEIADGKVRTFDAAVNATTTTTDSTRKHYTNDEVHAKALELYTGTGGAGAAYTQTSEAQKKLHVGANADQMIDVSIDTLSADSVGMNKTDITGVDITTQANAEDTIYTIQKALDSLSLSRADLGAKQNRLEHTIASLDVAAENAQSSESLIRDVNMADEMVEYSKYNILLQASQSMLAQANQSTQGVLSLF